MNKILVPIPDYSPLSLAAAYFAVEFAKRNPTKVYFLIFSSSSDSQPTGAEKENGPSPLPKPFSDLLQQARISKIHLDLFFSGEDLMATLPSFSREHHITEIILALPPVHDPRYARAKQQIESLRAQVESQVVIVRPKESRAGEEDGERDRPHRDI
jgi:hypothetical protein